MPRGRKKTTTTAKKPRQIRSYEERLAEYDKKIKYHQDAIEKLKARKEKMQNPPLSREDKKAILTAVAQSGLDVNELKAMLDKAKE